MVPARKWSGIDPSPYWSQMWMWELVDYKERVDESKPRPRLNDIIKTTAAYYGLAINEMMADRRHPDVVIPRHVGMYLAKKLTLLSFPQIGRGFGGRDHSTILHGVRQTESRMLYFPEIKIAVETIKARLGCHG